MADETIVERKNVVAILDNDVAVNTREFMALTHANRAAYYRENGGVASRAHPQAAIMSVRSVLFTKRLTHTKDELQAGYDWFDNASEKMLSIPADEQPLAWRGKVVRVRVVDGETVNEYEFPNRPAQWLDAVDDDGAYVISVKKWRQIASLYYALVGVVADFGTAARTADPYKGGRAAKAKDIFGKK